MLQQDDAKTLQELAIAIGAMVAFAIGLVVTVNLII